MGYRLNRLDAPVFMAVPKPMLTEFGIYYRLESCEAEIRLPRNRAMACSVIWPAELKADRTQAN